MVTPGCSYLQEQREGDSGFTGVTSKLANFCIADGYGKMMERDQFMQELMREDEYGYMEAPASSTKNNIRSPDNDQPLKKNDRVVWFNAEGDAVPGRVMFIGKAAEKKTGSKTVMKAGVLLVRFVNGIGVSW